MKIALSVKAFFGAGQTLPANISDLVVGFDECVVVVNLTVAFGTPDDRFVVVFWIEGFNHMFLKYLQIQY